MRMILLFMALVCCSKLPVQRTYHQILENLNQKRGAMQQQKIDMHNLAECSVVLEKALTDSIFPAWYNTKWDFNGTSNIPGEGEIACGYFVSTTLKHAGFHVNRYKLAQQASSIIVSQVCGSTYMKKVVTLERVKKYMQALPEGLYIVGLDYHVGFIQIKDHKAYFIHSDYINNKVTRELALESLAFQSSNVFVLGQVSNNAPLLKKWLSNTKIY